MTKNINTLLRNMKKSRNSNKPMLVVNEKPKKKKKVVKVIDVKVDTKEVKQPEVMLSKNVRNKIRNLAKRHIINFVPHTVPVINTDGYTFGVTDVAKGNMSDLGVSMDNLKTIMENEVSNIHDINGSVMYTNGYLKVYLNNKNNVTNVVFTPKMNNILNSKKLNTVEGANRLLVDMVMNFGESIENPFTVNVLNLRAVSMYVLSNGERVRTNSGDVYLSKHALERMKLRDIRLDEIKNSINNGIEMVKGNLKCYVGEFCTVVVEYGVVKTVYLTLNLMDVFGIKGPTHVQYKVISSIYRKEGKPVTDTYMIEKIRVGLGLVTK